MFFYSWCYLVPVSSVVLPILALTLLSSCGVIYAFCTPNMYFFDLTFIYQLPKSGRSIRCISKFTYCHRNIIWKTEQKKKCFLIFLLLSLSVCYTIPFSNLRNSKDVQLPKCSSKCNVYLTGTFLCVFDLM